jgi:hypothetical protein
MYARLIPAEVATIRSGLIFALVQDAEQVAPVACTA